MKYISIEKLGNDVYVFDETDKLCDICSYPLSDGKWRSCLSCNIFMKNKSITGGKLYFEKNLSIGKYVHKKLARKPAKQSTGIMTWLILRYKNNKDFIPACAKLLEMKILEFFPSLNILPEEVILCFVPDYENRSYKKGELLAKMVSERTKFEMFPLLNKTKDIKKQHNLKNIKEKFDNVKNAFILNNEFSNIIKNKTIFLIDDIVSSMASINECSKILKEAGAKQIYCFSLGRNILPAKESK